MDFIDSKLLYNLIVYLRHELNNCLLYSEIPSEYITELYEQLDVLSLEYALIKSGQ